MKKRIKINILSFVAVFAIVSVFIVPFASAPIKASAGLISGETDGNQKILLGLSDLENKSAQDNRENPEESLGASDISVKPPTTSPEIKENLESFEETEVAPLGMSLFMAPYANIGTATDFATLKSLIETDNGIDYIKMDGDIEITGRITVPATKPTLTIDGLYEGGRRNFVLTENKLSIGSAAVNIYAINTNITYIELKNMEIDGYNYYGPVYGGDRANFTIKYDNVIYDGPQLTWVGQGSAYYKDFIATIRGSSSMEPTSSLATKPGAAVANELVEAAHVTFEGNIKVETATLATSIWWAYGTASNLIFMPGTRATFNSYAQRNASCGYFVYGGKLNQIVIGKGADVTFNTPTGFAYDAGPAVETVFLEENASLKIVSNSTIALIGRGLRTKNFDAAPNSNFFLSTYNAPLIITGGMLNINNPASFVTHSTGTYSPIYMTLNSTVQVNAGAVNVWEGATTLSDDINNIPTNMWNKNSDVSNVSMQWTQGVSAATALTHNLLADDFSTNTPTPVNINLRNTRMVAIGQYDLSVTGHDSQQNKVSGQAAPNSMLRVSYRSNNVVQTEFFSADANGEFDYKLSKSVDIGTKPEVMLHQNYLKATHYAENLAVLSIEHVPAIIDFGQMTIPSSPTTMRWSDTTIDPWISVLDTRSAGSSWKLAVSAQPLTGTWNSTTHTLPNALRFIKDGQETILSSAQQIIYQGSSGAAAQTFAWDGQNGIFVMIDPGGAKTTSYTSTINWTLEDTP